MAAHIDGRVKMMRESFGEIGDLRLTVMAALMIYRRSFSRNGAKAAGPRSVEADRAARGQAADQVSQRDVAIAGATRRHCTLRIERIARMLAGPQDRRDNPFFCARNILPSSLIRREAPTLKMRGCGMRQVIRIPRGLNDP